jgi:hypothetical protein
MALLGVSSEPCLARILVKRAGNGDSCTLISDDVLMFERNNSRCWFERIPEPSHTSSVCQMWMFVRWCVSSSACKASSSHAKWSAVEMQLRQMLG